MPTPTRAYTVSGIRGNKSSVFSGKGRTMFGGSVHYRPGFFHPHRHHHSGGSIRDSAMDMYAQRAGGGFFNDFGNSLVNTVTGGLSGAIHGLATGNPANVFKGALYGGLNGAYNGGGVGSSRKRKRSTPRKINPALKGMLRGL